MLFIKDGTYPENMAAPKTYDNIVVQPNENYRGKPYSDWIALWANWLVSNELDNQTGPVFFLRSHDLVGYSQPSDESPRFEKLGYAGPHIHDSTAILVPVLTCIASEGMYPHLITDSMRYAYARNETNMSSMASLKATIQNNEINGGGEHNLTTDFRKFRVESAPFRLTVPSYYGSQPKILDKMELKEGTSDAVCDGIFILIRPLAPTDGAYKINIEAQGVGGFKVNAVYEIFVSGITDQAGKDRLIEPGFRYNI
jgi:hypothetical protein